MKMRRTDPWADREEGMFWEEFLVGLAVTEGSQETMQTVVGGTTEISFGVV
jgi:hypothetical protein